MPNKQWDKLNPLQLGRYAEYYAKMEFASYGYDVYTSEVDDHGVDFVARNPKNNIYYEVQVKSLMKTNYVFMKQRDMPTVDTRLVCVIVFESEKEPEIFIVPATEWIAPQKPLVAHDYATPEFGINLSKKNRPLMEKYRSQEYLSKVLD